MAPVLMPKGPKGPAGSSSKGLDETAIHVEMNRLRGKLCGFVEACSLPERQERAIISTLKSLSYDAERALVERLDQ